MTTKMFNAILEEGRKKHGDDWMAGKSFSYILGKIQSHLTKFEAGSEGDADSAFGHLDIIEFYVISMKLFQQSYPHCDDRVKIKEV